MWEGLTKKWGKKKKSSPSAFPGTRQRGPLPSAMTRHSGKPASLPSARVRHSAKQFFFSFNGVGGLDRQVTFFFAECRSSPSVALGKRAFAECRSLPSARHSAALSKASLPWVIFFPECNTRGRLALPSARFLALGEACDTRGILPLP